MNKGLLIGIVGKAGSGKDTVADLLCRDHHFWKVALADAIKRAAKDWWNFTELQLWGPSSERNRADHRYIVQFDSCDVPGRAGPLMTPVFLTPRKALQVMGTEIGRQLYKNTWIDKVIRIHEDLQLSHTGYDKTKGIVDDPSYGFMTNVVVSDVRFHNEIVKIKGHGGIIIKMLRGTGLEGEAGQHQSELEMESFPADYFNEVIDNRYTSIPELELLVRDIAVKYIHPKEQ